MILHANLQVRIDIRHNVINVGNGMNAKYIYTKIGQNTIHCVWIRYSLTEMKDNKRKGNKGTKQELEMNNSAKWLKLFHFKAKSNKKIVCHSSYL